LNNQSSEHFDKIINIYRLCAQTYTNIAQEHELDILLQRVFNQLDDKQVFECLNFISQRWFS
jgi:hypothetical protein